MRAKTVAKMDTGWLSAPAHRRERVIQGGRHGLRGMAAKAKEREREKRALIAMSSDILPESAQNHRKGRERPVQVTAKVGRHHGFSKAAYDRCAP